MKPKILLVDIETQPDLVYTWGVYEQNAIAVKENWQMLSFSAEWLHSGKVTTKGLCDYKGYKPGGTDYDLAIDLWRLLDEADIVVAHNGADFDIKCIKARFIAHGLKPPAPYRVVDTKKELKKVSRFSSNKLDWICKQLDLGKKIEHEGWELWLKCMGGDRAAWARMKKYNRHDVVLLKKLYGVLAPWITQPNAGTYSDVPVCPNPNCGSDQLQLRGFARNKTRIYQRFQCRKCGTWGRAAHSERNKQADVVGLSGGDWK